MPQAPTTRRRWFQFSWLEIAAVAIIIAALAWLLLLPVNGVPDQELFGRSQPIEEVNLEFGFGDLNAYQVRITDPKAIESCVVSPLRNSKPVPPRSLIALGTMTIHYDDGSTDDLGMFRPWGFWHYRGKQFMGDLSSLRDKCRQAVQDSGGSQDVADPVNWE